MTTTELSSEAWLLRGVFGSVPGELTLAGGQLSFTASGFGTLWKWQLRKLEQETGQRGLADRMDAGEQALVFKLSLTKLQVEFPWYYLSGGLKLRSGTQ